MSSFFAYIRESEEIRFIRLSPEVAASVQSIFEDQETSFWSGITKKELFQGFYHPEKHEMFYIENDLFYNQLSESLDRDESALKTVDIESGQFSNINAILTYSTERDQCILVQSFSSRQYLDPLHKIWLKFISGRFERLKEDAFTLNSSITAVVEQDKVYFQKFGSMCQIFDMKEFYEQATNEDVEEFVNDNLFAVEDSDKFIDQMDIITRKQIKMIKRLKILDHGNTKKIIESGKKNMVNIEQTEDGKIVIPSEKKELKSVLKVLSESVFVGDISGNNYETNSKKIVT